MGRIEWSDRSPQGVSQKTHWLVRIQELEAGDIKILRDSKCELRQPHQNGQHAALLKLKTEGNHQGTLHFSQTLRTEGRILEDYPCQAQLICRPQRRLIRHRQDQQEARADLLRAVGKEQQDYKPERADLQGANREGQQALRGGWTRILHEGDSGS